MDVNRSKCKTKGTTWLERKIVVIKLKNNNKWDNKIRSISVHILFKFTKRLRDNNSTNVDKNDEMIYGVLFLPTGTRWTSN